MLRVTRLVFVLMLLLAMNTGQAFADTSMPRTIDVAIAESDAIISATVDTASPILVDGERCGTQYDVIVGRIFKADRSSLVNSRQRLKIGRSEDLRVGREYLLFLQRITRPEDEYERLAKRQTWPTYPATARDLELAKCKDLIPGYILEEAWQTSEQSVFVFALWPRYAVPRDIQVESNPGPWWVLRKSDVLRYLESHLPPAQPNR